MFQELCVFFRALTDICFDLFYLFIVLFYRAQNKLNDKVIEIIYETFILDIILHPHVLIKTQKHTIKDMQRNKMGNVDVNKNIND